MLQGRRREMVGRVQAAWPCSPVHAVWYTRPGSSSPVQAAVHQTTIGSAAVRGGTGIFASIFLMAAVAAQAPVRIVLAAFGGWG